MLNSLEKLSDDSRIWIYQSSEQIDGAVQVAILKEINQFLMQWAAHGADLMAAATIEYDRFLIIATDENFNAASGCSIDSLFRFIQDIGKKHDIDLFNRKLMAFLINEEITLIDMKDIKQKVAEEFFPENTLFFNNNLQTKGQLKNEWIVKPEESWLKRYFQPVKSV